MKYTVVFVREGDGRYSVYVPALKGRHTQGDSLPHAVLMAEEVMALYAESLRERGKPLPEDVKTFPLDLGDATEAVVYRLALKERGVAAQAAGRLRTRDDQGGGMRWAAGTTAASKPPRASPAGEDALRSRQRPTYCLCSRPIELMKLTNPNRRA